MKTDFQNITILGGGLLGGSLALALGALENPPKVRLWARKQETVGAARDLGIAGATGDLGVDGVLVEEVAARDGGRVREIF